MKHDVTNVIIAGLGGQGVLTASDIVAEAAFRAGCNVKKSEIHGMSQRGGSVRSDVRFGPGEIFSPMVPEGEADFLVVLAADQIDDHRAQLREGGVLIGPERIDERRLSNRRTLNVALLGVLSAHLGIEEASWRAALDAHVPEKYRAVNAEAFAVGRETEAPHD